MKNSDIIIPEGTIRPSYIHHLNDIDISEKLSKIQLFHNIIIKSIIHLS